MDLKTRVVGCQSIVEFYFDSPTLFTFGKSLLSWVEEKVVEKRGALSE
jgi:hypothetical protein